MTRLPSVLLVMSLTLLLVPLPAQAAPPSSYVPVPAALFTPADSILAAQTITETGELTGSVRIATLLATYFDRDVQEILDLHAQEWGFGGIAKALFTAVEANVPLEQILQMRAQDIGWGEIRQSLGLPPGMPHKSLGQVIGRGHNKTQDWVPPGQAKKGPNGKNLNKGHGKP